MKLCIPENVLDQHAVWLGKTGAGKSSALRHVVEHLLRKQKRVCIVDPKGDWWGLKCSADGKGPGFPVILFGDFKEAKAQDVPINAHSGKHIAELITSGNRPAVIGFRGWMVAHMVQFWIDFAEGIFNGNSGELYLVGDEFHNFAPKGKILDPQAGKCLHRSNRLLSEGRGLGIVCLLASQRPQKVHNDTLTSCETLAAMRVVHAADRKAVKEWIDGCGDDENGKVVLDSLAGLSRGEAFVWSPEAKFGPEKVRFPMFETFDSFAPPQLQKHVTKQGWADVDLDAVREKLTTVIQEHKANDPAELKREVAQLKATIRKIEANPAKEVKTVEVEKRVEVPVLEKADIEAIRDMQSTMLRLAANLDRALMQFDAHSKPFIPPPRITRSEYQHKATQKIVQRRAQEQEPGPLGKCARAILTALVQHGQPMTRRRVALSAGYSITSGGFSNALSELRRAGAIASVGADLVAGENATELLGNIEQLPTGQELRNCWFSKLGKCAREILKFLCDGYPEGYSRTQVAECTGYSVDSGGFSNALSELRGLELIQDGADRSIVASKELFE